MAAPPTAASGTPDGTAQAAALRSYRLGAIVLSGDDASLRVRLPPAAMGASGAQRVEGLLSLRKVEGSWYVESLALDRMVDTPLSFSPNAVGNIGSDPH